MIDKLTIYFPYYNQPNALRNQLDTMSNYSEDIRNRISILLLMMVHKKTQLYPLLKVNI